jgi:hypothetical protein
VVLTVTFKYRYMYLGLDIKESQMTLLRMKQATLFIRPDVPSSFPSHNDPEVSVLFSVSLRDLKEPVLVGV